MHSARGVFLIAMVGLVGFASTGRGSELGEVAAQMERAARLLQTGDGAANAVPAQRDALRRLDLLIERLTISEDPSLSGERPLKGSRLTETQMLTAGIGPQPERPAQESMLPAAQDGQPPPGVADEAGGEWAPGLPEAERQVIADTFSAGRLPPHYRDLLRAYNRRLAETPDGD